MMFRRRILLMFVLLMSVVTAVAQDGRHYYDDSFCDVSSWRQERANFINYNDYLSDTSSIFGTDVISRSIDGFIPENGDAFWRISLMCGFENSSVNNFQFYLTANGDDPNAEGFCGMAIGTGFKPNYKTLSLVYRHDGITEVLGNVDITIKKNQETVIDVVRSASGAWCVGDSVLYVPDFPSVMISDHIVAAFTYNKTGAKQFSFKFIDFSQNNQAVRIPVELGEPEIVTPTTIKIKISGRLDEASVKNPKNYSAGGQNPKSVDFDSREIVLNFSGPIPNKGDISFVIDGLRDGYGNRMDALKRTFRQALPGEIVINEIMVDVNPAPFSLPVKKYVELYNTSAVDLDLDGYAFNINEISYNLPAVTIKTGEYLILASDASAFTQYGNCMEAFQESKLTVGGKNLSLVNKIGAVVDSVTYSVDCYNQKERSSGGFSMERLDPYNNCAGIHNWHASNDLSGGTPGRKNSVYQIYEDDTKPELINYTLLTDSTLRLDFSENISNADFSVGGVQPLSTSISGQYVTYLMPAPFPAGITAVKGRAVDACGTQSDVMKVDVQYVPLAVESVYAVSSYQVLVNFSTPVSVIENEFFTLESGAMPSSNESVNDGAGNSILLTFADDFEQDSQHRLNINGVENYLHNRIDNKDVTFKYHMVEEGDILVNEVMFYPNVGAKRYVEFYNNSGSDIFLFGLVLSGYTAAGDLLRSCALDGYSMLPANGYAVATADTANVVLNYNARGLLIGSSRFPSFNTSRGYVSLRSVDGVLLDSMYYDNAMHSNLLSSKRGVSLERISVDAPSMDADSWVSASELFGFATPGFVNSCVKDFDPADEDDDSQRLLDQTITIENRLMRPGNSDSEFSITFAFDRPSDPLLTVTIYDSNGREVRCVASEVMAYRGCNVVWDGRDRHGSFCKSGIYVVLIKAVDDSGWSFTRKEACVIGSFR